MKSFKITFMLLACIFMVGNLTAQIKIGPALGINMAKYHWSGSATDVPKSENKTVIAPMVGLMLDLKLPSVLGVQTGLFYSGRGGKIKATMLGEDYEDKYSTSYIQIPVNIYAHKFGFRVYVGPYVGFGIGGKLKSKWGPMTDDTKIKFKSKVTATDTAYIYQSSMDAGLNFGVGYKIGKLIVNAGYSMGMTNLEPKTDGVSSSDRKKMKYTNSAICISVGYFIIGK